MPEILQNEVQALDPGQPRHYWKLTIGYDGTNFCGYQFQPESRTVQGELTNALRRMLQEEIVIVGASRTDSGVHAKGQTVNFATARNLTADNLVRALNGYTPPDLCVYEAEEVGEEFHSTFDAKGKHYRYTIYKAPFDDPFTRRFHLFWHKELDLEAMREAIPHLVGLREFKGLQVKSGKPNEATMRLVTAIDLSQEGNFIYLDFYGKGFMYKQVRSLAGLLIAAGDHRIKPCEVENLCQGNIKNRRSEVAPPEGLCLEKVYYGQKEFEEKK